MKRGIITSPAEVQVLVDGFKMASTISADEIRFYLLYWDKVFIPTNNLVHVGIPDEDVLVETGAIYRPRIPLVGNFTGAEVGASMLNNQCELAKLMSKDTTTSWTMHQRGSSLAIPQEYNNPRDILRIELSNALLAPSADVEVYDVLDFKERHSVKLAILHELLDALYLEILSSPDPKIKKNLVIRDLERLIAEQNKTVLQRFVSTTSFDISTDLKISADDAIRHTIGLAFLNNCLELGATGLEIMGCAGISSTIALSAKHTRTFKYGQQHPNLGYLSNARKERVIG